MKNLSISERCFKIRDTEYHLRLITTKHHNEKNSSSLIQLGVLSDVLSFSKTKGIVEYAKKKMEKC